MKRLMSEGEYFSVGEMRKRNPLLFDQLLGHFLPDPESKIADDQEHALVLLLTKTFNPSYFNYPLIMLCVTELLIFY